MLGRIRVVKLTEGKREYFEGAGKMSILVVLQTTKFLTAGVQESYKEFE